MPQPSFPFDAPSAQTQKRPATGRTSLRGRVPAAFLAGLAVALFCLQAAWADTFTMTCPALHGDRLNRQHACEAEDRSPALHFSGASAAAKSLAVLMAEQGSPKGDATLWIVYNLPAATAVLSENQPHARSLKGGGAQLQNADGKFGYKGPCPTGGGTKRFFIEAFLLDTRLDLPENASRRDFLLAAEGHIVARAKLTGRYKK